MNEFFTLFLSAVIYISNYFYFEQNSLNWLLQFCICCKHRSEKTKQKKEKKKKKKKKTSQQVHLKASYEAV